MKELTCYVLYNPQKLTYFTDEGESNNIINATFFDVKHHAETAMKTFPDTYEIKQVNISW